MPNITLNIPVRTLAKANISKTMAICQKFNQTPWIISVLLSILDLFFFAFWFICSYLLSVKCLASAGIIKVAALRLGSDKSEEQNMKGVLHTHTHTHTYVSDHSIEHSGFVGEWGI